MRLLYYELKKIVGMKYLWAAFFAMLVVCCVVFASEGRQRYSQARLEELDAFAEFRSMMEEDPERAEAIIENVRAYNEESSDLSQWDDDNMSLEEFQEVLAKFYEELEAKYDLYQLGYKYSNGEPITDRLMVEFIDDMAERADEYRRRVIGITNVSEGVMKRLEEHGKGGSPTYKYERHFYELYSPLIDGVEYTNEPVRGWDVLFLFDKLNVFVLLFLMLVAVSVFINERTSGSLPILRATMGGRIKTSAAKLGALLIASILVVLIFTAAVTLECYMLFGLSSGDAPIQMFGPQYVNTLYNFTSCVDCPYQWTMTEYFAVSMLLRILVAAAFTSAVALISALFFSPVISCAVGAGIILVSVAANYFISSSGWLKLNLFCVSSTYNVLGTHTEVYFGGHFVSVVTLATVIYSFALVACSASAVIVGGRRSVVVPDTLRRTEIFRRAWGAVRCRWEALTSSADGKKRRHPVSLFAWECRKLLTPGVIAVAVLLLIGSVYFDVEAYRGHIFESSLTYEAYLNDNLLGEYTEEKAAEVMAAYEENRLLTSDEKYSEMLDKYYYGELTDEELDEYLDEYDEARAVSNVLKQAMEQSTYLSTLKEEIGAAVWFVSDVHLSPIFERGFDFCLLAVIVIIFSRVYTPDFAGGTQAGDFASIMRAAPRGRRASYRAKALCVLVISLSVAVIFTVPDFVTGALRVPHFMELLSAPMVSMPRYSVLGSEITVGGYLAAMAALRAAACVVVAYITAFVSFVSKKITPTLFFTAAVTLVPYVLVYMGVDAAQYVDITAMLSGSGLLLRSAELLVGGGTYTFAVIFTVAAVAVISAVILAWRRAVGK